MSTLKETNEAYRRRPTRVFMAARVVQSCGHLNHESMKRIRSATIDAFMAAAEKEGMTSTWTLDLATKTPKDFDVLLSRRNMALGEPESAGAVARTDGRVTDGPRA